MLMNFLKNSADPIKFFLILHFILLFAPFAKANYLQKNVTNIYGNTVNLFESCARSGVNREALKKVFIWLDTYEDKGWNMDGQTVMVQNKKYISLVDFSKPSYQERMMICNLQNGSWRNFLVAHGRGSDSDNDGWASYFSNREGSEASSLGFYVTGEPYRGINGLSLRLHGKSSSNSQAYERSVVIHGAYYMRPSFVQNNAGKPGRSWGCLVVDPKELGGLIDRLQDGSVIFAFTKSTLPYF